jgi:hypothetical protein
MQEQEPAVQGPGCPVCHGTLELGYETTLDPLQFIRSERFRCRDCGRYFLRSWRWEMLPSEMPLP